jgi:hypothetical protein
MENRSTVTTISAMSFVPFDDNDGYNSALCCLAGAFEHADGTRGPSHPWRSGVFRGNVV